MYVSDRHWRLLLLLPSCEQKCESGEIESARGTSIVYVEQEPNFGPGEQPASEGGSSSSSSRRRRPLKQA